MEEERGYMEEERGYMEEERGYIAGRARLYFCIENSGLPKLLRWSHALHSDQNSTWPHFNRKENNFQQ